MLVTEWAAIVGASSAALGVIGHILLRVDTWAHGPGALKAQLDLVESMVRDGNVRTSEKIGDINAKMLDLLTDVARLKGIQEGRQDRHP